MQELQQQQGSVSDKEEILGSDPKANSDTYYNHLAAMNASIKWKDGGSTPYDDNGGQMLPIESTVEIQKGDEVEVYYEKDSAWHTAVVINVTQYKDDVRYTVKYKVDRSTQTNVCVDNIRFPKPGKKKRKSTGKATARGTTSIASKISALNIKVPLN